MSRTYEPSTLSKYVPGPRGEHQINVRVDQSTWDALMALKARSGDTRTVGRWYGDFMAQLIQQQMEVQRLPATSHLQAT